MNLSKKQKEILQHMLGADSRYKKKQWGFRNHFVASCSGDDYKTLLELESLGYIKTNSRVKEPLIHNTQICFNATIEGCKALGFKDYQIKNTFND